MKIGVNECPRRVNMCKKNLLDFFLFARQKILTPHKKLFYIVYMAHPYWFIIQNNWQCNIWKKFLEWLCILLASLYILIALISDLQSFETFGVQLKRASKREAIRI